MLARKLLATGLTLIVLAVAAINGVPSRVSASEPPAANAGLQNLSGLAVSPASGETLYAAADGNLYRSNDAGLTWNVQTLPASAKAGVVAVDPANAARLYVGDAQKTAIYWYDPQAKTWQIVPLAMANGSVADNAGGIVALKTDRAGHVFAVTGSDGVYQLAMESIGLRAEAHSLSGQPVSAVAVDESGRAYALSNGQIYQAPTVLGNDWQLLSNLPSRATTLAVGAGNPATLYVGTESEGLVRSTDGGQTWEPSNEGLGATPGARLTVTALATDPINPQLLYAATAYWIGDRAPVPAPGALEMSADGGASWTRLATLDTVVTRLAPSPSAAGRVYTTVVNDQVAKVQAMGLTPASTAPVVAAPAAGQRPASSQSPVEGWLGLNLTPMQWLSWGVALLALAMLAVILFTRPEPSRQVPANR